ncbi:hypothetical protein FACS1894125_1650 [Actinomycetota bacterium]|nr:hypothetical protein FACS1894125_1650 [Actinomycetota bacterium]
MKIRIIWSALKHIDDPKDIVHVIRNAEVVRHYCDDPFQLLYLGFDTKGRALEVLQQINDDGDDFVFHADKITSKFIPLLERRYDEKR